LKFNLVRDIAPVASFNRVPKRDDGRQDVQGKDVAEFIAYAKANPGKVNLASSGNGTRVHLSGEMFMAMTGVNMQHVPIVVRAGDYRHARRPGAGDLRQHAVHYPAIRSAALRALAGDHAGAIRAVADVPTSPPPFPAMRRCALFGMGAPKNTPEGNHHQAQCRINADPG